VFILKNKKKQKSEKSAPRTVVKTQQQVYPIDLSHQ